VSAGIAQPVVITADWLLDLRHDELSSLAMAGSGIDDPVNDTGLGPERGDLQLANEFVCLIKVM
jgi:hypothetical protein